MVVFETKKATETEKLGWRLGQAWMGKTGSFTTLLHSNVVNHGRRRATIMALTGELGSGKTTFVRGLAKGLGIRSPIVSPTYVFVRSYPFGQNQTFYHLDLYRIDDSNRDQILESIEFQDFINDLHNVVVVEWAERLKGIKNLGFRNINFLYSNKKNGRLVKFN